MSDRLDDTRPGRLVMDVEGQSVFADYRRDGDRLIIDHVEAPPALRGTGAAGRFMAALAAYARQGDLKIVPICGYAAAWLRRSERDSDLIA